MIVIALGGGCPEPVQYGGPIPVDDTGLARRLDPLCRGSARAPSASPGCAPREDAGSGAESPSGDAAAERAADGDRAGEAEGPKSDRAGGEDAATAAEGGAPAAD